MSEREHITDGKPCWCGPSFIPTEDSKVVVHRNLPNDPGSSEAFRIGVQKNIDDMKAEHQRLYQATQSLSARLNASSIHIKSLEAERDAALSQLQEAAQDKEKLKATVSNMSRKIASAMSGREAEFGKRKKLESLLSLCREALDFYANHSNYGLTGSDMAINSRLPIMMDAGYKAFKALSQTAPGVERPAALSSLDAISKNEGGEQE